MRRVRPVERVLGMAISSGSEAGVDAGEPVALLAVDGAGRIDHICIGIRDVKGYVLAQPMPLTLPAAGERAPRPH
jgi:hypothetical protein